MPTDAAPVPDEEVVAHLGLRADGRRKRRRWPYALALGLVLATAGGLALALRTPAGRWTWTTVPVERGPLTIQVTAVGTLEPMHTVAVSSEVSGTVARVAVDTNDRVEAGQVLAELDTDLLAAQLRQVTAQVRAGKASLSQARISAAAADKELATATSLHAAQAVSDNALDQARTARDQAHAAVELAQAQLGQAQAAMEAAQTSLDKAVITAPISGVILARNVDPGQAVVSSLQAATLFEVAEDLARMSIDVEVDEADIGRIAPGQAADFTVAAWADRVFEAQVHKVELAPTANVQVVTYVACLHVDNQEGLLRPGMTATARIDAEHFEDALLVPTAALRFSPPDADLPAPEPRAGRRVGRVWVLDGDEPRPVEVVTRATDARRAIVDEGELAEGELAVGTAVVTAALPRKGGAAP